MQSMPESAGTAQPTSGDRLCARSPEAKHKTCVALTALWCDGQHVANTLRAARGTASVLRVLYA
jgi:hypothetical protein